MPAGVLVGGFLIEGIGLAGTYAILGVVYLLATLSMFLNPAIQSMDQSAELARVGRADLTEAGVP
jgi:hypothetical protein